METLTGALRQLTTQVDVPVRYAFQAVDDKAETVNLAVGERLGSGLRIEFLKRIFCLHCARATPKSYGGGYCYPCFTTLAR